MYSIIEGNYIEIIEAGLSLEEAIEKNIHLMGWIVSDEDARQLEGQNYQEVEFTAYSIIGQPFTA